MTHRFLIRALLASASLAAVAAPAWAQTASGAPPSKDKPVATVAEVVVTAQKRKERLQDVPESIAVVDQAQLQREQINSIQDLGVVTPSLQIQQASGQNPGGGGQIRGIGTQTFAAGAVGAVGIVVDQVSQGNSNINDLFDVARLEVLKGPQGTLFGLTTSAGVINIVTNAPDPHAFSAAIHSELSDQGVAGSEYGQQIVQGVVNLPLTSDSALRIAANMNLRQGVDYNAATGSFDNHDDYGIRAHYLWRPNDQLSVNVIGDYSYSNDHGADFMTITKANPADAAAFAACGVTASEGNRNYCWSQPQANPNSIYGVSAQIDYDFGGATVTSITSARRTVSGAVDDGIFRLDPNPEQIFTNGSDSETGLVTEELRIASPTGSKLEYTAGAFFSHATLYDGGNAINVQVSPFPGVTLPIVTDGGPTAVHTHDNDDSEALFGQATYHATDQFRVIFGARYTHETLDLTQTLLSDNAPAYGASVTEDNFSYKLGLQYDFSKNSMIYATYSKGYKGPQINNSNPSVQPTIINPELPSDYEIGLKNTLFSGRLATDLSLFYDDVKGFQGQQCLPVPTGLACGPVNYTEVISKGVEFNVFGHPFKGLTLNTGVIYNPVKYPGGTMASDGSGDLGGHQLGNVPLWKYTFSGEYARPIADGVEGYISLDAVYKSDLNLDNSLDPNLHYPAHWILGGRIGTRFDHGRFGVAVFVRNLTDNHEPVLIFPAFPNPGDYGTYYTPQSFRLVGISLDAKF
jgi:iron complex outermembrane receptor protein